MFNPYGLGAGQYVMYDRFITRSVAAPEGFHRLTGLMFVSRAFVWDMEGYLARLRGPPWKWARAARKKALRMESCLEVLSTTRGDGLSGIVPQSLPMMERY